MEDRGIEATMHAPSMRQFVSDLAGYLSSAYPPQAIFVHAPSNRALVAPLIEYIQTMIEQQKRQQELTTVEQSQPTIDELLPASVTVDLAQIHSTRQLFDTVLNNLSGWTSSASPSGAWDDARGAVVNWDGRLEGLELRKVQAMNRKRRRRGAQTDIVEHARKKQKRSQVSHDDDDPFVVHTVATEQSEGVGEAQGPTLEPTDDNTQDEVWTLEWDRSILAPKEEIGPLRDSVEYFQNALRQVARLGQPATLDTDMLDTAGGGKNRFIVVDHAERLPELATGGQRETGIGSTFVGALLRLRDLSRTKVSTILISQLGYPKFSDGQVGVTEPICITFPDINDTDPSNAMKHVDSVEVLASRFASTNPTSESLDTDQLVELFKALAGVIWSTYSSLATDLDSLAYMTAKFWPKWLDCVENSNPPIAPTNIAALHQHIKPDLARERDLVAGTRPSLDPISPTKTPSRKFAAAETRVLHGFTGTIPDLPDRPQQPQFLVGPGSPSSSMANQVFSHSATPITPLRQQAIRITPDLTPTTERFLSIRSQQQHVSDKARQTLSRSLPVISRYLLIAAYYASFNPPKSDVRHFVKVNEDERVAKRGKKGRKISPRKGAVSPKAKMSLELGGGKSFPIERMFAIFESITQNELSSSIIRSIAVQTQIVNLIQLRLLLRSSGSGTDKVLDGVKLKCNVTKDVIDVLAENVGMGRGRWREYLWDPEA
ncbi:hypothetical protein OIO90_000661 [Microbotryomycetes sp. JL221]|nr:hypothetical protein OIO90_000661 [Microbotryomycetes sp. JL221]